MYFNPKRIQTSLPFIVLVLVIGCFTSFSQTKKFTTPAFVFDHYGDDLTHFLRKSIRYPAQLRNGTDSCKALVFGFCVRFVVNASGKVSDISFSNQVHSSVQEEMQRVVNLTNNHWKARGGITQQAMILPVIYARGDCLNRNMDGVSGTEYQAVLNNIFDFLYKNQNTSGNKTAILPTIQIVAIQETR
ncbi:hypothetical protein QNI16_05675 [Cytophagaceae bacterium YF14B1]|uniref:TonB C-terminal domain-containing protein n=1 Tax=Xanthocytophaga flava TaxID=3048013 RepID=A0AAE3QIH8_9BACT|nr:hypothetical protein [Xanthocytophaga flavus]MDJ1479967.1 hypothetical protein [Xanthocytophaga flavus]